MFFSSFLQLFICNRAHSYDEGRVVFKRKRHWLFPGSTDVGKETKTIQKGNKWKWEDLQVVIRSSNFHLETSSLFSSYIRTRHHGSIFGVQNTNKSHQQLHSIQMWSKLVCQNAELQMKRTQKSPKCFQGTRLKAFLWCSKTVSLISAIIALSVP